MPNALDKEDILRRSLIDSGCDKALTEECIRCFRDGTLDEMLPRLIEHRKCVLADIRKGQKRIDCIDYLTNEIKAKKY